MKKKPTFANGSLFGDVKPTSVDKYAHEHVHEHVPTPVAPRARELKDKRIPLMVKPSTVTELDEYAKVWGITRNELLRKLIGEFLSNAEMRTQFEVKYLHDIHE